MDRSKRGTRFIGVDLSLDDYEFLRSYAARDGGRPMTSVLRALIQNWIFDQRLSEQSRQASGQPAHMAVPPPRVAMSSWSPTHPEAREIPEPEEPDEVNAKPGDDE